jgi:hypothetical protein
VENLILFIELWFFLFVDNFDSVHFFHFYFRFAGMKSDELDHIERY